MGGYCSYPAGDCPFEGKRCLECTFFYDADAPANLDLDDYDYSSYNREESDYERGDREWDEI